MSTALFRPTELAAPLGSGTVGDALDGSLRFRFDKQGKPSEWALIADNRLSADFLASAPGASFASKLGSVLQSVDAAHERGLLELVGVNLARDEAGWAATSLIQDREMPDGGKLAPGSAFETAKLLTHAAGAQAIAGWVQVTPDYSRNILSSLGAYTPTAAEKIAGSGEKASYIGGILAHELQHHVSPPDFSSPAAVERYMPLAWLEEGTASFLTQEGRYFPENQRRWGVTPHDHASAIRKPDSVDVGWKPWVRSAPDVPDLDEQSQANYVDSVKTLRGLFNLVGIDLRTNAGHQHAVGLLQDQPVDTVPTMLAEAILNHQGTTASAGHVPKLAELITGANTSDGLRHVRAYVRDAKGNP